MRSRWEETMTMTLYELSFAYEADAVQLRMRITELREQARRTEDAECRRALCRRMAELEPLLRQSRELAKLTRHYYERGYHRSEKYTV